MWVIITYKMCSILKMVYIPVIMQSCKWWNDMCNSVTLICTEHIWWIWWETALVTGYVRKHLVWFCLMCNQWVNNFRVAMFFPTVSSKGSSSFTYQDLPGSFLICRIILFVVDTQLHSGGMYIHVLEYNFEVLVLHFNISRLCYLQFTLLP